MNISDYLKNIEPVHSISMAFFRGLRKFNRCIVESFSYLDNWGNTIEVEQRTQNASLTEHGQKITDLVAEQVTQNNRISALEESDTSVDLRVSNLEDGQKTLNDAIEVVEKEQSVQNTNIQQLQTDVSAVNSEIETVNTDISAIKSEQETQNSSIETNTSGIEELWKSIGFVNTNLNTLNDLVYDSTTKFKINTTTVTGVASELFGGLCQINFPTKTFDFPSTPYHVTARASLFIYNDEEKTNYTSIVIPVPVIITMGYSTALAKNVTRLMLNSTTFYAPYGVKSIYGVYVCYLSHV